MNLTAVSTAPDTGLGERWPGIDAEQIVAATLVQHPGNVCISDERWDIPRLIAEIRRLRRLLEAGPCP